MVRVENVLQLPTDMSVADMLNEGPSRGVARLYAETRKGRLTEEQFVECVQELVFQALMGIEDMEDEEASLDRLLHSPNLPAC